MSALIRNNHTGPVVANWVARKAPSKRALDTIDTFTFPPCWAVRIEGASEDLPAKGTVHVDGDLLAKILSNKGNDVFFAGDEPYLSFVDEKGDRVKPPEDLEKRLRERSAA